jgi:hypothetical protein
MLSCPAVWNLVVNYVVRNSAKLLVATGHQEGQNPAAESQQFVSPSPVKKSRPIAAVLEQPVPWVPKAVLAVRRTLE